MAGKLYVVPTPVGNLDDMTFRAVKVLEAADYVLAEDTRTSKVLLDHYGIRTSMRSHHKFNEHDTSSQICDEIDAGAVVALVSDAGTPGISDPGFFLSRECRRRGLDVECLPGATAFVPALVSSGLPCDRFVFEGFLPPKKGRATRLTELAAEKRTVVVYESPKRLPRTLRQMGEYFGRERNAAVCREISKLHESIHKGTLGELTDYFDLNQPKGEIVIVVEGVDKPHSHDYGDLQHLDDTERKEYYK